MWGLCVEWCSLTRSETQWSYMGYGEVQQPTRHSTPALGVRLMFIPGELLPKRADDGDMEASKAVGVSQALLDTF
ncbi:hypothetical protein E2C01_036107 [Portunus trituberculatus]|uniref:Uncharacterized protein n=1 Tax=Portunus trituberculatus TaxID=210409 RepID=A0A5B7FA79_PORTR|nr:hypothetical protein [Portunus trituberculatus]